MLGSELAFVHFYLILDGVPKYSSKQWLPLYNPFKLDESQLIGILVIRRRVEYFLFGDWHIRTLRLPRHSPNGVGYIRRSGAFDTLFNYCIHSRGKQIKGIESLPLQLMYGQNLTW